MSDGVKETIEEVLKCYHDNDGAYGRGLLKMLLDGMKVSETNSDPSRVDWEKMESGMIAEYLDEGSWYFDILQGYDIMNSGPYKLPDRPDLSVWKPWRGGECPVTDDAESVALILRSSDRIVMWGRVASEHHGWIHGPLADNDIIAYMVLKDCPECIADMGKESVDD